MKNPGAVDLATYKRSAAERRKLLAEDLKAASEPDAFLPWRCVDSAGRRNVGVAAKAPREVTRQPGGASLLLVDGGAEGGILRAQRVESFSLCDLLFQRFAFALETIQC
jgi:hypothetical protein